jgi:nitrate reductase NapAB chaperone NapD
VPISGLVVVFESLDVLNDLEVEQLFDHPNITVGERSGDRVAIAVDSNSKDHDADIWNWLSNLPGVIDIKIAFVGFDDEQPKP